MGRWLALQLDAACHVAGFKGHRYIANTLSKNMHAAPRTQTQVFIHWSQFQRTDCLSSSKQNTGVHNNPTHKHSHSQLPFGHSRPVSDGSCGCYNCSRGRDKGSPMRNYSGQSMCV